MCLDCGCGELNGSHGDRATSRWTRSGARARRALPIRTARVKLGSPGNRANSNNGVSGASDSSREVLTGSSVRKFVLLSWAASEVTDRPPQFLF